MRWLRAVPKLSDWSHSPGKGRGANQAAAPQHPLFQMSGGQFQELSLLLANPISTGRGLWGPPASLSVPRFPPALRAPAARATLPHGWLYISAKFELMMGTVFVILHQAALVSGIYLSCCFGSFFQSLLSSDMSGLQSKRNSEFTFTVRQAECYYPCICHQPADPSL